MEPASLPRFPWGRFNEAFLRQDVQTIQNLYNSNGFRDAKITYKIKDDFLGADNHLAATINIEEGLQWFVSSLKIERRCRYRSSALGSHARLIEESAL